MRSLGYSPTTKEVNKYFNKYAKGTNCIGDDTYRATPYPSPKLYKKYTKGLTVIVMIKCNSNPPSPHQVLQ